MSARQCTLKSITEDEFIERFRPVPNHLDLAAGFDLGDGGCLYATSPKEWQFIVRQNPRTVWTLIEEDGRLVIESGIHIVNRLGYLVTEEPIEPDTAYSVVVDQ